MPGFDRTGPRGAGPMTGGARGLCNPRGASGAYPSYGAGFRGASPSWPYLGRGRGGQPRCWYGGAPRRGMAGAAFPGAFSQPASGEVDFLKEQASLMKRDMEEIERRIQELEKQD